MITPELIIKKKKTPKVPDSLIYEIMNGNPIYYRGYKNVLSGKLNQEGVMGSSALQSFFISLFVGHLLPKLKNDYTILYGELGLNMRVGDNLSMDIAIYHRSDITVERLWKVKYADFPPLVVVEVDTKAAPESVDSFDEYFVNKTQKYLDFGVEQVVWLFTKSRKIWVAKNDNKPWLIMNWHDDLSVLNQHFTINQLIEEYGFDPLDLRINQ